MNSNTAPDLILHNGRITTLDPKYPEAKNLAIKDGRVVGVDDAEAYERGPNTEVIDLNGRRRPEPPACTMWPSCTRRGWNLRTPCAASVSRRFHSKVRQTAA